MYLNVEENFAIMSERQPLKQRGADRKRRQHRKQIYTICLVNREYVKGKKPPEKSSTLEKFMYS